MRTFSLLEKPVSPGIIDIANPMTRASTYTPPPPFSSRAPSPAVGVPSNERTRAASPSNHSGRGTLSDMKVRAGTY